MELYVVLAGPRVSGIAKQGWALVRTDEDRVSLFPFDISQDGVEPHGGVLD